MSNGDLDPSRKPWAQTRISPAALMGAVAREAMAVENAEGDIQGANANLREEVARAQRRVDSAEEHLTDSQQALLERLRGMDLLGRSMGVGSGTAIAEIKENGDGFKAVPSAQDLSNTEGVLAGFEVGAIMDEPLAEAGTIVLMVATDGNSPEGSPVPQGVYAVAADKAEYTLGEVPQPQAGPDEQAG